MNDILSQAHPTRTQLKSVNDLITDVRALPSLISKDELRERQSEIRGNYFPDPDQGDSKPAWILAHKDGIVFDQ
jgi:hypothetical protein